jgi:glycosyltransferase involved in cell wall biosynthesis
VRRLDYAEYSPSLTDDKDYIFAMSTLWYDDISFQSVNRYRGEFIRVSKYVYSKFEGGLFYIQGVEDVFPPYSQYKEDFKDILHTSRVKMKDYLNGTKQSAVVFNTPSVCQCHGWKLAEYLSMGKAIISTPLSNVMPGEFVDGVHYISCDNLDNLESILRDLHDNEAKRQELKYHAKKYFEEYLSPKAVVLRILDRADICVN